MIKCEVCGRTIDEIVDQDGSVTILGDGPLVCDRCQKREESKQQTEILDKALGYDKIKRQLNQQKEMWHELKSWILDTLKQKRNSPKYYKLNDVLDKINELEKDYRNE